MIDLSQLPPPDVVEALDFEKVYEEIRAAFASFYPEHDLLLESDPAIKLLELAAYREIQIRARINDAARAVMLAYATGADLDNLAAIFDTKRLGGESDASLRARAQLAQERYTVAGSVGSYIYHGLSADANVADISAISPQPGSVTIYVLSRIGNGAASEELLATVSAMLNAESIRPMTDSVTVQSANIVSYAVQAELIMQPGPDASVVLDAANAAIQTYTSAQHAMRRDVTLSGIYAALHQPGVQRVNLIAPIADIVIGDGEASYCTGITVTVPEATDV